MGLAPEINSNRLYWAVQYDQFGYAEYSGHGK